MVCDSGKAADGLTGAVHPNRSAAEKGAMSLIESEWEDNLNDVDARDSEDHAPRRSADGSELISCAMGGFMMLLTFWGIGWSFYRHGPGHGVAALFIPPYAWYRGVAALWDGPTWKEDWDQKTETIATIMVMSTNDEAALEVIRFKDGARTWISSLPQQDKERLRKGVESFGDAVVQYRRNLTDDLSTSSELRAITHPSVETFVKRFSDDRGLRRAWGRIKTQDKTARAALEELIAECPPEKRQELLQSRDLIRLACDMEAEQIRGAIADLFEEDHRE